MIALRIFIYVLRLHCPTTEKKALRNPSRRPSYHHFNATLAEYLRLDNLATSSHDLGRYPPCAECCLAVTIQAADVIYIY